MLIPIPFLILIPIYNTFIIPSIPLIALKILNNRSFVDGSYFFSIIADIVTDLEQ
jgi:hypothetical protein